MTLMMPTDGRSRPGRGIRLVAVNAALLIVAASVVVTTVVGPASAVAAATVTFGAIQAQMANQLGENDGTAGNCITYAPPGTTSSSTFVVSPDEAQTAHGLAGRLPDHPEHDEQSASDSAVGDDVGDGRHAVPDRADGPLQQPDQRERPVLHGQAEHRLMSFTAPNTIAFPGRSTRRRTAGGRRNDLI